MMMGQGPWPGLHPEVRGMDGAASDRDRDRVTVRVRGNHDVGPPAARRRAIQFEMRLQTVVGEFYSEVGYNFNFEKP